MIRVTIIFIFFIFSMMGCGDGPTQLPKPRLYPKIDFPDRNIKKMDLDFCAFSFDFPDYGTIVQDSFYFDEEILDKCWFDIIIKSLNGRVHCSYIPVKDRTHFEELVKDAYELVFKHNVKANFREETPIHIPEHRIHGFEFDIDGPVASHYQFYLTDSLKHFIRGSIYFESQVDQDSIAPILTFVKKDVQQMIQTFEWK